MAGIKTLAKETAVYGLSSIIGRFLNWCLTPLYVYLFMPQEYGIVSYLYSFTAVALVILNYGMETGFFRFANKEGADSRLVYTTSIISTSITSAVFCLFLLSFIGSVSDTILLPKHPFYVGLLGCTVAIDAFCNIPFAWLRFKRKALSFAGIKLLNVALNIALNLFFLLALPKLAAMFPAVAGIYEAAGGKSMGIGWIFIANAISSAVVFIMLNGYIPWRHLSFNRELLKKMLGYSWPLLVLGVAGIMSQNMGQIIIPYLFEGQDEAARSMVGIYGANIKIAIVMVMFTQAFRYAYEPFIFAQARNKGEEKTQAYCDAMKFFVAFGIFIFLCVMFFLPVLKYFVAEAYWEGLRVVPVMMVAELCFGVFFNLSLWYKLTDRTRWGMYFSLFGFVMMLSLNIVWVRQIGIPDGYMGSAWAALVTYFSMMVISWLVGRHYYPIPYPLRRMAVYCLIGGIIWVAGEISESLPAGASYGIKTILLLAYIAVIGRMETIPVVSRLVRGKTIKKT